MYSWPSASASHRCRANSWKVRTGAQLGAEIGQPAEAGSAADNVDAGHGHLRHHRLALLLRRVAGVYVAKFGPKQGRQLGLVVEID